MPGRVNLNGRGHARNQPNSVGHLIDSDAYRHTLGETDPGEDGIYRGETRGVRLRVRNVDRPGETCNMPGEHLAISHEFNFRLIAFVNLPKVRLFEIAVEPVRVGIYDRNA